MQKIEVYTVHEGDTDHTYEFNRIPTYRCGDELRYEDEVTPEILSLAKYRCINSTNLTFMGSIGGNVTYYDIVLNYCT